MKKKNLLWLTIAFIVVLVFGFMMQSCKHKSGPQDAEDIATQITSEDVAYVKACLNVIKSETFNDPDKFMDSVSEERHDWKTDSIISCVDIKTLNQIVDVVYKKYGIITRQLVAKEYQESYDKVYKYIQEPMSNYIPDTLNTEKDGELSVCSVV